MNWALLFFLILLTLTVLVFLNIINVGTWWLNSMVFLVILTVFSGYWAYKNFQYQRSDKRWAQYETEWIKQKAERKGLEDFGKRDKLAKGNFGVANYYPEERKLRKTHRSTSDMGTIFIDEPPPRSQKI